MDSLNELIPYLKKGVIPISEKIHVYEKSLFKYKDSYIVMIKDKNKKHLICTGQSNLLHDLEGKNIDNVSKLCDLTHENRLILNNYFPFTVPRAFGRNEITIGLGDRIGMATPGHIKSIQESNAKPIFAQQSIRELNLTNRTMEDVIDCAAFSVFQEGYILGYGADGDHLKDELDISREINLGISMLTLDCSDYIKNNLDLENEYSINMLYDELDEKFKRHYEATYLNQVFQLKNTILSYTEKDLKKAAIIYSAAIQYMIYIYQNYIQSLDRPIDFEISIDETQTVTTPHDHFFVANELNTHNIMITSMAPRFCGEFQKGIDYIGDIDLFNKELHIHSQIADYFKYKLSIHSGSDKFSIYNSISQITNQRFHLKTAGTNWLEALRLIAKVKPDLYEEIFNYSYNHFNETQKFYHITPNLNNITPLQNIEYKDYYTHLNNDNVRQLLHVSFGILLTAKDNKGNFLFKNRLQTIWNEHEEDYHEIIRKHINKHLKLLNLIK